MTYTVKRNDFVTRSRVTLNCDNCGTTTIGCDIGDAYVYEDGFHEHVCSILDLKDGVDRAALRRMFRHLAGGAL